MSSRSSVENEVYDLIGLGFGPSNLALSATIEEEAETIFGHRLQALEGAAADP